MLHYLGCTSIAMSRSEISDSSSDRPMLATPPTLHTSKGEPVVYLMYLMMHVSVYAEEML